MAEQNVMQPGHNAITAAWAAVPEERRAIILAGEAAIMNRRRAFDDWLAVGRAFRELQLEAMRQSNSREPKGRRYGDAYELLELPPEIANLHKIDKSDRAKIIWLYENEAPVRRWYETLGQNQRDRWTHPQTIKLHYGSAPRHPAIRRRQSRRHRSKSRRPKWCGCRGNSMTPRSGFARWSAAGTT